MTPAEHAELSARVARAIGYYPESVRVGATHYTCADDDGAVGSYIGGCDVYNGRGPDAVFNKITEGDDWYAFDYRDPSVALPVLEWLMREHGCRPMPWGSNISIVGYTGNVIAETFTLPEAIARAVIAVADAKRRQVEQNEAREVLQP